MAMRSPILPGLLLTLLVLLGLPVRAQGTELRLMSLNTYCFPEGKRDLVKFLRIADLTAGIDTSISQRIDRIADLAADKNAEVVFFQELWGASNKNRMIAKLQPKFKFVFWNDENAPKDPSYMDDGLLIASQRIPFLEHKLIYRDRVGDENAGFLKGGAQKGAIMIGVYDRSGKAILLVNTHMQSGTGTLDIETKGKQVKQLADEIRSMQEIDPRLRNAQIIIGGDFNEPVGWREGERRLVDRSKWLTDAFNAAGVPVLNNQLIKRLISVYRPNSIVEVHELKKQGLFKDGREQPLYELGPADSYLDENGYPRDHFKVIKTYAGDGPAGPVGSKASRGDEKVLGQLLGNDRLWSFFQDATDPIGRQVLDFFLVDDGRSVIKDYKVLRFEVLGDSSYLGNYTEGRLKGEPLHYNSRVALSDHAAILATISAK